MLCIDGSVDFCINLLTEVIRDVAPSLFCKYVDRNSNYASVASVHICYNSLRTDFFFTVLHYLLVVTDSDVK